MKWDREKESAIDPSRPGQNQPDRQEAVGVTGLRRGQRPRWVALFTLRDWQHPLNLLAFPRSRTHTAATRRRSSEGWRLFTRTDWKSGINKSHQSIGPSICPCVCLLPFCVSGCMCVCVCSSGRRVRPLMERLECEGTLHPHTSLHVCFTFCPETLHYFILNT